MKKTLNEVYEEVRKQNAEKPVGVMIATPMYGGMCTGDYALSLSRLVIMLKDLGYNYYVESLCNESLIPRGRNLLAKSFLERPDMDYMIFIDADIGFREIDVLRLLLADRALCGGVYPKKRINWNTVRKAALAGKERLQDYTGDFVFNLLNNDQDGSPDEDGMLEVKQLGTGFMLIHKSVFEQLKPVASEYTEHRDDGSVFTAYDFFPAGVSGKKVYVSEDYGFCDMWKSIGGKLYMNPFLKLTHTGSYVFSGDLQKMGTEQL
jgi:hypothetical protein